MRQVQWLFGVSALLFIFAIGFVVVGARASRSVAPPAERATIAPVATVKQIMAGIVGPDADTVFNAVSTTVSDKGVEEVAPRNDDEWTVVGNSAAMLAEAGNLMMMDGRAVDRGDWIKMSQALVDAGKLTLEAVAAKSPDAVLVAGEAVNVSCDSCHERYRRE